jgi:hypothetical protein
MLAALKAKMEKGEKKYLNLSYNSKPHCKVGLFLFYFYCLSNKAKNVFSLFLHPHRLDYSYLPFISVFVVLGYNY